MTFGPFMYGMSDDQVSMMIIDKLYGYGSGSDLMQGFTTIKN